jgi:hypothetical protein
MINNVQEINYMLTDCDKHNIVYQGYWHDKRKSEYVFILKKV